MKPQDILVRGAGAVGLCTALALSRQGLSVALLGSLAEPEHADVRAYALNAGAVALLRTLKVWDALPSDARTPVHEMHVEGDAAGAAIDFSAWQQSLSELAWIVDAAELERALRAAVKFSPHVTPVTTAVPAALQVLAEGKASATRAALGVRMERHGYGQTAVAARLTSDRAHGGLARQWFRSPDVLALLPLDRPTPGHGLALVWSLPDEAAQTRMALNDADFTLLLNEVTGGAAGQLTLAGPRAQWPLSLAQADRLCGPGWVLVGDAAHVVHPLAGQGLNLGLADVASLAAVIAARESWRSVGDVQLLRRHVRARALPTLAMARVTDGLLHLFANDQPLVRELRNRGMSLLNHLAPIKRLITAKALDA